jgi:hypothetical protein
MLDGDIIMGEGDQNAPAVSDVANQLAKQESTLVFTNLVLFLRVVFGQGKNDVDKADLLPLVSAELPCVVGPTIVAP